MRSVGPLPVHSTPGLLDRLGASRVSTDVGKPHAVCKEPRHRAHQQIVPDRDREMCDARVDAKRLRLERRTRFRIIIVSSRETCSSPTATPS